MILKRIFKKESKEITDIKKRLTWLENNIKEAQKEYYNISK